MENTRETTVEAARLLFWERGYEATTLAAIAERAEVNLGSIYYFFPTKEELLLSVLDRYTELLWPRVIEPAFKATTDPLERVFAILAGYRQGLIMTHCTHGCPVGNLALEVGDLLPRARQKIASNFQSWKDWIRKCLEDPAAGLPRDLDRAALATFVLSVMEGGVMQARAFHSLEPFDQSADQLRRFFQKLTNRRLRNEVTHETCQKSPAYHSRSAMPTRRIRRRTR